MIVGVTGYAQHGKDSVAAVLVEEYGFTRVGFADALKELTYRLDPNIPGAGRLGSIVATDGWEGAKKLPEVRRVLQVLGTGAREVLGPNVWVEALRRKTAGGGRFVIPDVRFSNEADFIHDHGGQLWRVHRPHFDNGVGLAHVSESSVEHLHADIWLENDATLQDLTRRVQLVALDHLGLGVSS